MNAREAAVRSFESKRYFRFWEYAVAQSSLVIRSASSAKHRFNLDLVFRGVFYTQLIEMFDGLVVSLDVPEVELKVLASRSGQATAADRTFYRIESNQRVCYVGASSLIVEENTLELFETPPSVGDREYPRRNHVEIRD